MRFPCQLLWLHLWSHWLHWLLSVIAVPTSYFNAPQTQRSRTIGVKKPNPVLTLSIISSSSSYLQRYARTTKVSVTEHLPVPWPSHGVFSQAWCGRIWSCFLYLPKMNGPRQNEPRPYPRFGGCWSLKGSTSMRCSRLEILDCPAPSPQPPPPSPPPSPSNHQSPGVLYWGPEIQAETCFLTKDLFPSYLT